MYDYYSFDALIYTNELTKKSSKNFKWVLKHQ